MMPESISAIFCATFWMLSLGDTITTSRDMISLICISTLPHIPCSPYSPVAG
jgi:hypothetical protein